jgi:hypothetical protein
MPPTLRCSSRTLLTILVASLSLMPVGGAAEETRHTGKIVAIQPDRQSFTLEEMGPWTGPQHGVIKQVVRLAPDTKVVMVTRAQASEGDAWPGGFTQSPIAPSDLRPGDYVTVEGDARKGHLVARWVTVVRPAPE